MARKITRAKAKAAGLKRYFDEVENHIAIEGEELSQPIYWQGRQWAVTHYGIERLPAYFSAPRAFLMASMRFMSGCERQ